MLHRLCAKVESVGGQLISFSEFIAYDETPLPVKSTALEETGTAIGDALEVAGGVPHAPEVAEASVDTKSKILRVEFMLSLFVKHGDRYQDVQVELPCPLQVCDRDTGEVYACATDLCDRFHLNDIASKFKRRDRHVMSDSDAAVLRGERGLLSRNPRRTLLQGFCRLHRISAIASKGVDKVLSQDVTGIINVALALQSSGAMRLFRKCLRGVIKRGLVVLRGSPGPAADRRRSRLLEVFCPVVPADHMSFVNRAIVQQCANGNWDHTGVFEVFVSGEYNFQEVLHFLSVYFVRAVAARPFRPYPRSRWTGARETLQQLGLLLNMHGLFQSAFQEFCSAYNITQLPEAPPQLLAIADNNNDSFEAHLPPEHRTDADSERIVLRNKYLRCGLAFTSDVESATRLVVLKMVVEPQQALLQRAIELSGKAWDRRENSSCAFAEQENMPPRTRRYRIQEVFDAVQEEQYLRDLRILLEGAGKTWDALPLAGRTSKTRCLAFRLLSFGGAWAHIKIMRPSQNFPHRCYRWALESIETGDASHMGRKLLETRKCRLDLWALGVLEHYGDAICSEEAVMDVATRATHEEVDNARREATHASIRRDVLKASAQSPTIELQLASGRFVDRKGRQIEGHRAKAAETQAGGGHFDDVVARASKKVKGGGGGACRAFLSEALSGVPKSEQDLKYVHARYKALAPWQKRKYQEEGAAATQARQEGNAHPFGLNAKELARASHRRQQASDIEEMRASARAKLRNEVNDERALLPSSLDFPARPASATSHSLSEVVAQACRKRHMAQKSRALEQTLRDEALARYTGASDSSAEALDFCLVLACLSSPTPQLGNVRRPSVRECSLHAGNPELRGTWLNKSPA